MAGKPGGGICIYGAEIMLKQLAAIQAELDGVSTADDIECIHRMRVASRRLRAAQELFDVCLPRKYVVGWEKQIRSITRSLGKARDLDIQIEAFREFQMTETQPAYLPGFRRLMTRLIQRRSRAQLKVHSTLSEFSTDQVIPRVQDILTRSFSHPWKASERSTPLRLLAFWSVNEKLGSFLSYEPYVHIPERKLELHAMRIAAKKLRYTLEIFAPIYPDEFKSWLRSIREVQDQIGAIHDCDMWIDFLPEFLEAEKLFAVEYYGHSRPHYRIIPGVMVFYQNRQSTRDRLYNHFGDHWDLLQKKRIWQRLNEHLEKNFPAERTMIAEIIRPIQDLEVRDENSADQ